MTENGNTDRSSAAVLLARGLSAEAAGVELGIHGRRIRRWREDPQFEAEVQHARRVLLDEAVAALTPAVRDAVSVLHAALGDRSAAIRIRAASELIRALPLLAEHAALESRIAALEARQNEMETPSWQAA